MANEKPLLLAYAGLDLRSNGDIHLPGGPQQFNYIFDFTSIVANEKPLLLHV